MVLPGPVFPINFGNFGSLRFVTITRDGWKIKIVLRPHNSMVYHHYNSFHPFLELSSVKTHMDLAHQVVLKSLKIEDFEKSIKSSVAKSIWVFDGNWPK